MNDRLADLASLSRAPAAANNTQSVATRVPAPRFHWPTRVALPAVALALTGAILAGAARKTLQTGVAVQVVPVMVKTTQVEHGAALPEGGGAVVVQAPGWVEADPFPTAVTALAGGVVQDVLVLEGQRIERGQVVARLIDDDAHIALAEADALLAERQSALASAEAMLEEAQRNWEYPIELTRLLRTTEANRAEKQAELDRWPAELARAEAHAVYLQAEYERLDSIYKDGQASDIEWIESKQAYEVQQAEVEFVRRRKAILEAQLQSLDAEVEAARENLRLRIADTRALAAAEAATEQAKAAVATAVARRDDAALQLDRMQVRSPVDGVVMVRLAEPGAKLLLQMDDPRSAQVVRLYDPQRLQVRVDVPLVDAAKVGVGQPAEIVVDVLPDRVFTGRVTRIVHEADVQKNTLQVKVAIDDPSPEVIPEMLARARFLSKSDTSQSSAGSVMEQIYVPKRAVFEQSGAAFVWIADQVDDVARRRAVAPGRQTIDDWIAIADGLQPGDRVIVDAPADLADGDRIRLIES